MSARTTSTVPSGLTKSIDKDQSLLQGLFLFIWGTMGWADNPRKEHLVAFAKAFDLALKKVWIL
jgi:hypothetical protein